MSKIEKRGAAYVIFVGAAMFGWWGFLLAAGQMPELKTAPYTAVMHLAAEFSSALGLIVSGIALAARKKWAKTAFLVASGMLFYAVIQATGYFAQMGSVGLVVMFAALLLLAGYFVKRLAPQDDPGQAAGNGERVKYK